MNVGILGAGNMTNARDGGRVAYPRGVRPEPEARPGATIKQYVGDDAGFDAIERLNRLIASGPFEVLDHLLLLGRRRALRGSVFVTQRARVLDCVPCRVELAIQDRSAERVCWSRLDDAAPRNRDVRDSPRSSTVSPLMINHE